MTNAESEEQKRKRVLDALGSYQKRGRVSEDVGEIGEMLMDESDRGVVVILGSMLEDALLERIEKAFNPLTSAQKKNLTRAGGLLSTFNDRVNLAHALGLINQSVVDELQIVKAMRNACAHSRLELTFLTTELREAVLLLLEDGETKEVIRNTDQSLAIRIFFIALYVILSHEIKGVARNDAVALRQSLIDSIRKQLQKAAEQRQAALERRRKRRASVPLK